jgi:competence protein ComEC
MRPLILAGAWLAALAGLAVGGGWPVLGACAAATALALAAYRDRRGLFLALAALGAIGLAILRWQMATAPPPAESIAWWADGGRREITGRVRARPEVRGATQRFTVEAERVESDAGPVSTSGRVQVRVPASRPYRTGDLVRLDGRLEEPPVLDGFNYRAYLARRQVFAVMEYPRVRVIGHTATGMPWRWLEQLHERAHEALWTALPAPRAALAEGILLGRRADIPRDIDEDFSRAGVSHLVVISGYNIAVLGGLVLSATSWLIGRRRAAVLAMGGILLYCAFVGFTPPVARAAVMGSMTILALLSGRPYGSGAALVFAAAALTLQDPRILQDVSFQLSFAATAGLVVLGQPLTTAGRRVFAEPEAPAGPSWRSFAVAVWDTLAVTLAAGGAATPILLVNFGQLSVVGPLANLLLTPLFPAVLATGALGLAGATVMPELGAYVLAPLDALLALSVSLARFFSGLPGATAEVRWFTPALAAIGYALLALAAVGRVPRPRQRRLDAVLHPPAPLLSRPAPVLALAPAVLAALMLAPSLSHGSGAPTETRIDITSQPPATIAVVTLAGGGRVLVDTGLSPRGARSALDAGGAAGARLDAIVITQDAPSTTGGLAEVIRRYRPRLLLVPPEAVERPWTAAARTAGVEVVALRPRLTVGRADAHLEVVPGRQAGGWLVTVRHGGRTLGLTGATAEAGAGREGGASFVYALTPGGLLRARLTGGATASVSTDGRGVRLRQPRGQRLQLEPCPATCAPGRHDEDE